MNLTEQQKIKRIPIVGDLIYKLGKNYNLCSFLVLSEPFCTKSIWFCELLDIKTLTFSQWFFTKGELRHGVYLLSEGNNLNG